MKEQLSGVLRAIHAKELPVSFDELFADCYDYEEHRFTTQETSVLDYKEHLPYNDPNYVYGLLKLIVAFHNTYGGLIIFGVRDSDLKAVGVKESLDIEKFNALLTDFFGVSEELLRNDYPVGPPEEGRKIVVLLIPKRTKKSPARLLRDVASLKKGSIFLRDRHQAIRADERHLPLLFSSRTAFEDPTPTGPVAIHVSMPPSPATMQQFISRSDLSLKLWEWFTFGKNPRQYLSGAGGSGKSTLAHEFAAILAVTAEDLVLTNGGTLDYIVYVSAKETEFNVTTATEQPFVLRQFSSAEELFTQILVHSGLHTTSAVNGMTTEEKLDALEETFDSFNGFIVIDDIDTLSRAGIDTGEEELFYLSSKSKKITKILYTLRNDASFARNASISVPGLELDKEFPQFVDACCAMFQVPPPEAEYEKEIIKESSALPLLVETIIGLRKSSSNYAQALRDFKDRGGEAARKYLYQREYDKLKSGGKSRQVLAALVEYGGSLDFDALSTVVSATPEQTREAITDTVSVFLKVRNVEGVGTLYELSQSAIPFIRTASQGLAYYGAVKRAVEQYRTSTAKSTPAEAVTIIKMEELVKSRRYDDVVVIARGIGSADPLQVNPRFMAALGRAYVQATIPDYTAARDLFQKAMNFGHSDIFMMRAWYHAERNTGYRFREAADVCQLVISGAKFSNRHKSEFYSKLGDCLSSIAKGSLGESPESRVRILGQAVIAYVRAMHSIDDGEGLDRSKTVEWLQRATSSLFQTCRADFSGFFDLLAEAARDGVDLSKDASQVIAAPLYQLAKSGDLGLLKQAQGRLKGVIALLRRVSRQKQLLGLDVFCIEAEAVLRSLELQIIAVESRRRSN
ncbi:RNA-binding domain-containing protein [Rubellimicrobium roseum]|uniref:ATP-binding protein n=1 Tax=Rubellimicrobium roseum TaxID=687525 RepID=A0A5C4NNE4_9RHOB|nr:RNA-binding domain-containing protein [Rubellimicrobium roseum]TNC74576.1 ATP-binding protein [Rubellimicrobium roseum]